MRIPSRKATSTVLSLALLVTLGMQASSTTAFAAPGTSSVNPSTVVQAASKKVSSFSVRYRTFIPQDKVKGPTNWLWSRPCGKYDDKFKFGGDNRGFHSSSGTSRTALFMTVNFSKGLTAARKNVRATNVYNSKNVFIEQKRASDNGLTMKVLSRSSKGADVRMTVDATNPFCWAGAIVGSFVLNVKNDGSYAMQSGTHRRMPNHEVYIQREAAATWKTVYQSKYLSAECLASAVVCREGNFTSRGKF